MKKIVLSWLLLFTAVVSAEEIHKAVESAVMQGDYSQLKEIISDNPSSINAISSEDSIPPLASPLDIAVWQSHSPELVAFLVEHGADVNARDPKYGNTPLHIAVDVNNLDVAKLLVENGADVNAKNAQGNSPLREADNGSEMQDYLEGFAISLADFLKNPLRNPSDLSGSDKAVLQNIYNGLLTKKNQGYLVEIGKKYSAASKFSEMQKLFKDLYEQDNNTKRQDIYKKNIQQLSLLDQKKTFFNMKFKFEDAE